MKRAKLTQIALASASARGADLTDRLLDREGGASGRTRVSKPSRHPSPVKPKALDKVGRLPRSAQSQADLATPAPSRGRAADLPEFTPYRTVAPGPPAIRGPSLEGLSRSMRGKGAPAAADLKKALAEADRAVAALVAAAGIAPARYDLAVRYRLDALVHHLRQVAEFMASIRT